MCKGAKIHLYGRRNVSCRQSGCHISFITGPAVYWPLAAAVAAAQRILIAARGRRSYSKEEFIDIFDKGFVLRLETVTML